MSIQAIAWVLEHSVSEGSDRLVLLAIANHCDARDFHAWPAVNQIAVEARVHRRTVIRCVENLVALGELEVRRGGGRARSNRYRIFRKQWQDATVSNGKQWQDATLSGRETVTSDPETVTSRPLNGGRVPPEPSLTVKNRLRTRARTREAPPRPEKKQLVEKDEIQKLRKAHPADRQQGKG